MAGQQKLFDTAERSLDEVSAFPEEGLPERSEGVGGFS
jgi:hypothetical protein